MNITNHSAQLFKQVHLFRRMAGATVKTGWFIRENREEKMLYIFVTNYSKKYSEIEMQISSVNERKGLFMKPPVVCEILS